MVAEWLMSQFAHKVVGVSEHTTENLIRFEKISPKKTMTIVNGIDGSKYGIVIDKGKKRKELGLKETGPVIGACVRLTEQKGLSYLLEAVQRIKPHFPDISVVVAGEGPLEQRLINQCRDSGIDKNVFFIGPRTDVPEILKLLDIYVLPSVWEGLPMILLEAMAAECPIIASRVGGVPGIIENGRQRIDRRAERSRGTRSRDNKAVEGQAFKGPIRFRRTESVSREIYGGGDDKTI